MSDGEHEYLRQHVDPVLMPLIEALLLYQPESIYEFICDYVDERKSRASVFRTVVAAAAAAAPTSSRRAAPWWSSCPRA